MSSSMSDLAISELATFRSLRFRVNVQPRQWLAFLLLGPSLVFLFPFTYWPAAEVIWQSFHEETRGHATFSGLRNYAAIFSDAAFRKSLVNNAVYAVGTMAPSLVLALGFALALQRSHVFNVALRSILFLPVLVPLVAAASMFLFVFLPGVGLLDHYLAKLGMQGANWIGDPDIALTSIMVLTVWKNAGYYMLFFLAGLQAIPPESYEAAALDGASPWQRLRYVTLPYLRQTSSFVLVIAAINVLTQVDHIFVLTKGGPSDSTKLLLFYVYEQAVERYDFGKAAAATVVSLVILLAISGFSLSRIDRDMEVQR